MPRRLLSAAAACTLLLGLAACGEGGDGPVTTPPPSIDIAGPSDGGGDGGGSSDGGGDEASPSAAPEVPAPDPADYPGMDEHTPEGAEQAFRYYMALMICGYQTGNVEDMESREIGSCKTCAENRRIILDNSEAGLYWSATSIEDVGVVHYDSEEFDFEVGYIFVLGEHEEPNLETGELELEPATRYTTAAVVDWVDGAWKVVSVRVTAEAG